MKTVTRRYIGLMLTFVMCIGMIFGINITAYADNVDYVKDGKYIYNWGNREEVATFLSQNAIAFYNDNNTSYAALAALSGSSDRNSVPSSALYKKLQNLMELNHTYDTSYGETRYLYQYTDCQNSGKTGNAISSFYSGNDIGPDWDTGSTWNREHTWPKSKTNYKKVNNGDVNEATDIMSLRPTATSENGSRNNKAYGTTTNSNYFNPNQFAGSEHDLRGDVARIMLYVYVRWGNTSYMWGSSGVIESREVLLEWIEEDPVDTWELGRNDSVESITGTRNVFVDYPELAFVLFGEQVPSNYTTPSGNAKNGTTPAPTPTPDNNNQNNTQNNNQNNTQNNTQSNNQNNTQNNTQNNSQNNTQNNTQTNSSTISNACSHAKAYKVAAEEPRCESEGYTEGRYCPDCKRYISGHKAVDATGHSYAGECDAFCDVCNDTREIDAEHTLDDDGNCTVCGEADIQNPDANEEIVENTEDEIQDADSNEQASEKGGFAWWIIVVVAVVIVGAGAVVIVIYRDKIWPKEI